VQKNSLHNKIPQTAPSGVVSRTFSSEELRSNKFHLWNKNTSLQHCQIYVSYIRLTDGSEPMISNLGALAAAQSTPLKHTANNPSSAVETTKART
jgi:hypothetical protein